MPMQAMLIAGAEPSSAAKRPLGDFPRVSQAAQDAAAVFSLSTARGQPKAEDGWGTRRAAQVAAAAAKELFT